MSDTRKKSGSQVPDRRRADVLGARVETIGGSIVTKAGMKTLIGHKTGVGKRQQRAAVSSYIAEGWTEATGPKVRLHDGFAHVDSATSRVLDSADARYEARLNNGKRGGRPKRL